MHFSERAKPAGARVGCTGRVLSQPTRRANPGACNRLRITVRERVAQHQTAHFVDHGLRLLLPQAHVSGLLCKPCFASSPHICTAAAHLVYHALRLLLVQVQLHVLGVHLHTKNGAKRGAGDPREHALAQPGPAWDAARSSELHSQLAACMTSRPAFVVTIQQLEYHHEMHSSTPALIVTRQPLRLTSVTTPSSFMRSATLGSRKKVCNQGDGPARH